MSLKALKKPLLVSLYLLPVTVLAGVLVCQYQIDTFPKEVIAQLEAVMDLKTLMIVGGVQSGLYAFVATFFGYLCASKVGLLKPCTIERKTLRHVLLWSVVFGLLFSLDYWVFGGLNPAIKESVVAGTTVIAFISAVLYGGIVEELLMRFFMMSLFALLIKKLLVKKEEMTPTWVLVAANLLAALLFAAGHLPSTIQLFGTLTPLILFRCFSLNGGFGLFFGRLYRKYGLQYAMIAHAMLHIVSKIVWLIFL